MRDTPPSRLLLLLLLLPSCLFAVEAGEPVATITRDELTEHVKFLASDDLKGRESGTPEGDRAAEYIAALFGEYRLRPHGDSKGGERLHLQAFRLPDGRHAANVVGVVEGTDPQRRREHLVIGAHYDHVGLGRFGSRDAEGKDQIHNGADDNASGTASLLELAQAFAGSPPRRSIVFLAFAAEEKGLLGSKHWCDNPSIPLRTIVTMINLDMVGRSTGDYLFVGGLGTGTLLKGIVDRWKRKFRFNLEEKGGGKGPSDFEPFYLQDIPVLFFFTNVHEDYHRPGDDWEKINYEAQERITRLVYHISRDLADGDGRPRFQEDDSTALPDSMMGKKGPVLGVELKKNEQGEVVVSAVAKRSGAEKAGLREGDVLLQIGKDPVESPEDVAKLLADKKPNDVVVVKARRQTRALLFRVKLRAP